MHAPPSTSFINPVLFIHNIIFMLHLQHFNKYRNVTFLAPSNRIIHVVPTAAPDVTPANNPQIDFQVGM